MPRTPDQQAQEKLLRAAVSNDEGALTELTRVYGPIDSEKIADELQVVERYFDPETPRRIKEILNRRKERNNLSVELEEEQVRNVMEGGLGHGYNSRLKRS